MYFLCLQISHSICNTADGLVYTKRGSAIMKWYLLSFYVVGVVATWAYLGTKLRTVVKDERSLRLRIADQIIAGSLAAVWPTCLLAIWLLNTEM